MTSLLTNTSIFRPCTTAELTGMDEKNLVQRENTLKVEFSLTNYNSPYETKNSQEYIINGATLFQLQVKVAQVKNGHSNVYNNLILVKFAKTRSNENLTYIVKFSSKDLDILDKSFITDDGTWHLIHENQKQQYNFDVSIVVEIEPRVSTFACLHNDEEILDFELRGEDGVVGVHRVVLAAASPVLRRMLGGAWRENAEGQVDVPGTSRKTLQHLKDYIYLLTLPETGLEPLLLLAAYYMMPDLEQKCVDKLVKSLTPENACELLEFASKNKVTRLLLAILECVQRGEVNVSDMRKYMCTVE